MKKYNSFRNIYKGIIIGELSFIVRRIVYFRRDFYKIKSTN